VFTARAVMPMFGFAQSQNELRVRHLAKDPPGTGAFRGIFTAFPPLYIEAVIILRRGDRLVLLGSQTFQTLTSLPFPKNALDGRVCGDFCGDAVSQP
jgi:hypothetical protein